jgi:hypothetical protein
MEVSLTMTLPTKSRLWPVALAVADLPLNGELAEVPEPWKGMAKHLAEMPTEGRAAAFATMLVARPDRDEIVKIMADLDTAGPPPTEDLPQFATAADVRRHISELRWIWEAWIPADRIIGIAASEGTGKTRLIMDICCRIYFGEPWPDGQPATLPKGTPAIWVCADGHHDEIVEIMSAFGLPDDAIVFPTSPDEPYGGTDIDDHELIGPGGMLEQAIQTSKPGLVIIDTLTNATERDLCAQNQMKTLKDPLVRLAQKFHTTILLSLHLSKEGQALGRRINGVTPTLIHLECPDPENYRRLRLWVEKSYAKKPPALAVTMGDKGNTYDKSPPTGAEKGKGGRPPVEKEKAIAFL